MVKQITQGDVSRLNKKLHNDLINQQKKTSESVKKNSIPAQNELMGIYKKAVIDNYIKIFAENYGDTFDYNSLVSSFSFSMKDKENMTPSFNFDVNHVQFKSDAREECQPFNENSISEFISNDEIVSGQINHFVFDNIEEYEAYENGDILYNDLSNLDGMFISTSTAERYNKFNKINKLKGYRPAEESAKDAGAQFQKTWKTMKDKVLSNIIKKFKL